MTQPLVLFFGLVNIPNWYMDWVLTNAQFELLVNDSPIIVYDKRDKDGSKVHTKKELDALRERWSKQKKVDLNEFLRKGEDAINDTKTE